MRELPEIEVLRRELEREVAGRKIKAVDVQLPVAATRARTKKALAEALDGAKIDAIRRRGVLLLATLDDARLLVVRLGDNAGFRKGNEPADAAITITFTQGPALRLIDADKTTEVFVVAEDDLATALPGAASLGVDPLDEPMTWVKFGQLVSTRAEPMKHLLLDPTCLAGLGDVYADEVLFEAGVRYDRRSNTLSSQEMRRLYRSLIETLHDAVKHRGTSLGPHPFTDLTGKPGEHQDHLQVYGRDGKLSPRSRTPIKKVKFEGRWTYYCDTQV